MVKWFLCIMIKIRFDFFFGLSSIKFLVLHQTEFLNHQYDLYVKVEDTRFQIQVYHGHLKIYFPFTDEKKKKIVYIKVNWETRKGINSKLYVMTEMNRDLSSSVRCLSFLNIITINRR